MHMKNVNMPAPIGVPIVGSVVAFVLVTLALFSGTRPGFMEDYNIIAFNTSELGKNLIPTAASSTSSSAPSNCIPGVNLGPLEKGCSAVASAAGSVESKILDGLRDIEDDIADKLADKLGVEEFYSLHVMDLCEGSFTPNATTVGASRNVTNCTAPFETAQYNITAHLDHELKVGPLKLNLADLHFTQELQDAFDFLPELLEAIGVIFAIAMGLTGLALLGSLAALFLIPEKTLLVFRTNTVIAGLSCLALLVGSLAATIGALKGEKEVNEHGDDVGISAQAGRKFMAITWSATGLMIITVGFWIACWIANKRGGAGFGRRHGAGGVAVRKSESSSAPMGYSEQVHHSRMQGGRPALPLFEKSRAGSRFNKEEV